MNDGTLETRLHTYCYMIDKPADEKEWRTLSDKLKVEPGRGCCMHSWPYEDVGQGRAVHVETEWIYDNQWNGEKFRFFDWYLDATPGMSNSLRRGHWLELTPAMLALRARRHRCGYCGHQYDGPGVSGFCLLCLGSQYLKHTELHLTRIRPVSVPDFQSQALSGGERAYLLPLYQESQKTGRTARDRAQRLKERATITNKALDWRALEELLDGTAVQKNIAHLRAWVERNRAQVDHEKTERAGMLWLMDAGIRADNCIYYSHKDIFCFGWHTKLPQAEARTLLAKLAGFPFDFEVVELPAPLTRTV